MELIMAHPILAYSIGMLLAALVTISASVIQIKKGEATLDELNPSLFVIYVLGWPAFFLFLIILFLHHLIYKTLRLIVGSYTDG